jgi:hypothetical protein
MTFACLRSLAPVWMGYYVFTAKLPGAPIRDSRLRFPHEFKNMITMPWPTFKDNVRTIFRKPQSITVETIFRYWNISHPSMIAIRGRPLTDFPRKVFRGPASRNLPHLTVVTSASREVQHLYASAEDTCFTKVTLAMLTEEATSTESDNYNNNKLISVLHALVWAKNALWARLCLSICLSPFS